MAAYRGVFRNWSNICNGAFSAKILKLLTISAKKSAYSARLKIGFRLRVWNIELTLVHSLQIKPKKYSARKYVWRRFWKDERSWCDSKQECLCSISRLKGSLKRFFEKFCRIHKKTSVPESLFCCFLVSFVKFVRAPFLQSSTGRVFLIIAVSVVAKGVLANGAVNYDTKTEAYVLILAKSVSY